MQNDKHIGGVLLACDNCGRKITGVHHTPELISERGKFCIQCHKASKKEVRLGIIDMPDKIMQRDF